ncbi:MAG: hypothetical protein ACK5V3_12625 [Bdellovibrionales bacterium]
MKCFLSFFMFIASVSLSVTTLAHEPTLQDEMTSALEKCVNDRDNAMKAGFGMQSANYDKGLYGLQVVCIKEIAQNLLNVASQKLSYRDEAYSSSSTDTIRRVFDDKKRDFFCIYRQDTRNKRLPVCYLRLNLDSVVKK